LNGPQSQGGTTSQNGPQSQGDTTSQTNSSENSAANSATAQNDSQLIVLEVVPPPTDMLTQSVLPSLSGQQDSNPIAAVVAPPQSSSEVGQTPSTPEESAIPEIVSINVLGESSPVGAVIPEASTWTMTIAGFAALGLFKRRRIASALRSLKS
jgi:hypothetical protein